MKRVDIYIKVEVEIEEDDPTDRLVREICRQLEKLYAVRKAEITNTVSRD